ncbi:MAG: pimeloyl-ACP methyl ester carboxylesterase [Bacteroidia bacterium]|jgi:pimeloyl-ACP methyl ester carboxylesterase
MQKAIQFIMRVLGGIHPRLGAGIAFFLFFKPFRLKSHPKDLEKKATGTQLDFTIANKKTSAWYWGEGPVVILVHGWSSKGFHFRNFIDPMVKRGLTVVIPDLPGHVNSEGKSTNVLEFKETINAIITHFGQVNGLVGHSLGAMACILLLADNEVVTNKLVVFNSAVYAGTIMDRFMEQIHGNDKIRRALYKKLKAEFGQDFDYYSTIDRIQEVSKVPDLLVIGDEHDLEVPVGEAKDLAKLMKGELHITQNLGHNGGIKDPDVVDFVVDFLAKKNRA